MIGKMDQGNSEDKFNYGMIKLSQFVQQNQIQIEQFWDKHQIFVDVDQFKQFMIAINFPETEKYFKQIVQELQDSKKTITLERLCKRIPYWNNSEEIMIDLIKQKALRIVQSANRQRPQTGSQSLNRPMSGISVVSKYSAFSDLKNLNVIYDENESKVSLKNNSKMYLKKHEEKQKEIDKMLQITIKKGQYEYEYETHIKMAEINDILQRVKPNISYRKYKQNDGSMKVHQYDGEYFIRDFTLDEFQREYNIVKQQYDQYKKQQKKEKVEVKKDAKEDFQTQPSNSILVQANSKQNKQKERLLDLKQVLLETMILTNVMKQQIQVLNKKGINSDPLFIG